MKYAVVFDRPYYPSIELFETLDAAIASAECLAKTEAHELGIHASAIYVVEVISVSKIATSY